MMLKGKDTAYSNTREFMLWLLMIVHAFIRLLFRLFVVLPLYFAHAIVEGAVELLFSSVEALMLLQRKPLVDWWAGFARSLKEYNKSNYC